MRLLSRAALTAVVALVAGSAARADLLFNFRFDDTFDYPSIGTPLSTVVGTGFVRFASDPGDGLFTLNDLGVANTTLFFDFGFATFDLSSLITDPNDFLFFIDSSGGARRLFITGDSATGAGIFGGAPTFSSGGFFLEFEPIDIASSLDSYVVGFDETAPGGSYLGLQAPEPSSVSLLALGAVGGAIALRRRVSKASLRRAA